MLTLFLLFRALFGFETYWSIRNARISQLKIIASLPCVLPSHGAQVAFCDGMVNQLTVAMNEWMGKWRAETAVFYGRDKLSIFVPWKVQLSVSVVLD